MIIQGHVLDILKIIDDGFFDCIITSPPYWGLRDYGLESVIWDAVDGCPHEWGYGNSVHVGNAPSKKTTLTGGMGIRSTDSYTDSGQFCSLCGAWRGSLGLEPTFQLYLDHLMQIMSECKRVLKKTGTMWINIGDSYGGSGGPGTWVDNKQTEAFKRDFNKYVNPNRGATPKSLCGIPERFAIRMTDELGLIRRNTIVWYKRNCMPTSASDRFTVDFEYVYFFTKSGKYWFEQQFEPYTAPLDRWGGDSLKADGESSWDKGTGQTAYRDRDMRPNNQGRNKRCVWDIPTKPSNWEFCSNCNSLYQSTERKNIQKITVIEDGKEVIKRICPQCKSTEHWVGHFAIFPETLVEPMLNTGCPVDGWVLDPFTGAGTVGMVAKAQDKNFIGIDLNPKYVAMAEKRIG